LANSDKEWLHLFIVDLHPVQPGEYVKPLWHNATTRLHSPGQFLGNGTGMNIQFLVKVFPGRFQPHEKYNQREKGA
jgi:hypothetical protein